MWVSHEECEIHLTGRLEGRLLVAMPFLCWGAVLETCVLAVFPRIMAVASSFCHLQQAWVAVGTPEAYSDPQLHEPITREGSRCSHFPASMVHEELPAAPLNFPCFCLLFATTVVGRGGSSQPMARRSEDELSFPWDSLHKPLQCRAQVPHGLGQRCSCVSDADQEQTGGTLLCETHPKKCKQLILNSTGRVFSGVEQGGRWGNRNSYWGFWTRQGSPSTTGDCVTLCKKGSCWWVLAEQIVPVLSLLPQTGLILPVTHHLH